MNETIQNFVASKFVEPSTKSYLPVVNPATGEEIARVPDSNEQDLENAVVAAKKALGDWAQTGIRERSHFLRRMATLILERVDLLAHTESLNSGKTLKAARSIDIPRSAYNFEFFADAITQWSSQSYSDQKTLNYVLRQPLGVVGCISPWNLPLYLFTWKIAPALAAGNCVVAKPSEITPMTANILAQISVDAGLPAGVLNIVHGLGAKVGAALCKHPMVKALSFTGSTRTGAEIAKIAAPKFKKLSLEMGGKNATLVFADCDFERTVSEVARSAFSNQGQICLCGSRILVEKTIYTKFREALVQAAKSLKVGDPLAADSDQGALVSRAHYEKIKSSVEQAKKEGATVLCGGKAPTLSGKFSQGYFFEPTLLEGLTMNCATNQEEIFGPVATLMPFEGEAEALELANFSDYGLAASVWTSDLSRAHRLAEKIEAGVVWVNSWMVRDLRTPFGGMKNSGVGREGGFDALSFFTETKNVCFVYVNERGAF